MINCLREPNPGDPISANLIRDIIREIKKLRQISGPGIKISRGPNGTTFSVKSKSIYPVVTGIKHPWSVSIGEDDEGDKIIDVYIPDGSLVLDGGIVHAKNIDGITSIEGKVNHYKLDETDLSSERLVMLQATMSDGEREVHFSLASTATDEQIDEDLLTSVPIARILFEDGKDEANAVSSIEQLAVGTIVLESTLSEPDEMSIDANGGEDGEHKLQLYHFTDDEQDLSTGLAERLQADPKTGLLTSDDTSGLMLVGRLDGKVVYLPLSGNGDDPDDPDDPGSGGECDHDSLGGGVGGVSPDNESPHGGVPAGGVPAGGVPAGGDTHRGDDNCNCF